MIERDEALHILKGKQELVVDGHTHCGADHYNIIHNRYPATQNVIDLVSKMKNNGIDFSLTFPCPSSSYYFDFYSIAQSSSLKINKPAENFPYQFANKQLMLEIELFGENRIFPFLSIYPGVKEDEQIEYIDGLAHKNLIFGLKLHTLATNKSSLSLVNSKLIQIADKYSLPITFHSGPDEFSSPLDTLKLSSLYPNIRIDIAHLGQFDGKFFDELSNGNYPNVFIDSSPIISLCKLSESEFNNIHPKRANLNYLNPKSTLIQVFNLFPNALIWGTDEPWTTITNGKEVLKKVTYSEESGLLRSLPKDIRIKISNTNTMRYLFG